MRYAKGIISVIIVMVLVGMVVYSNMHTERVVVEVPISEQAIPSKDQTLYTTDVLEAIAAPSGLTIGKYDFPPGVIEEMSVEDLHRLADLITILSATYVGEESSSRMVETMFIGYE